MYPVYGLSLKAPLRDTPLNSLFLDTLQGVELYGYFNLYIVRLEGIKSRESSNSPYEAITWPSHAQARATFISSTDYVTNNARAV